MQTILLVFQKDFRSFLGKIHLFHTQNVIVHAIEVGFFFFPPKLSVILCPEGKTTQALTK